jgi:preprotein translocase subunit SecA
MTAQITLIDIGVVSSCYLAIIGVIYWVSHSKVNNKTFDVERQNNQTEHSNIRKWIEDAEKRSEQRHKELRQDLTEVKELIRNNEK